MIKLEQCNIDGVHSFEVTVFNPHTGEHLRPSVRSRVGLRVDSRPVAEVSIDGLEDYPEVVEAAYALLRAIEGVAAGVVGSPEEVTTNTNTTPPPGLVDREI
jgi:hypothetical protein